MQIALTNKLAKALKMNPEIETKEEAPLFTWTANWITTWDNRRAEDTLVLVNHANRYTVVIYELKRKDLKDISSIIKTAIKNTILAENINPEIVEEYMLQAGEINFTKNTNRKATAWVNHAGRESSFYISLTFNGIDKMFNDTIGAFINNRIVKDPDNPKDYIAPDKEMIHALTELTGKPSYNYQAFELRITLDLERYRAIRRIIVPADISFQRLHNVLQDIFGWSNYHLYDFTGYEKYSSEPLLRLVPFEEDLDYDPQAVLMENKSLNEYFPHYKQLLYTYDYGDNWEHEIELVRVIENHDENSPYLLEASGQTPPEDVGGVDGYLDFLDILLDSSHPEHDNMKNWAEFWSPELSAWEKQPRLIQE